MLSIVGVVFTTGIFVSLQAIKATAPNVLSILIISSIKGELYLQRTRNSILDACHLLIPTAQRVHQSLLKRIVSVCVQRVFLSAADLCFTEETSTWS